MKLGQQKVNFQMYIHNFNQFVICKESFINIDDVLQSLIISMKEAACKYSNLSNQDYEQKCKLCKCKAAERLFTSKCHFIRYSVYVYTR